MADMAPALTGAAQEAPHRLKLGARGGLLLLNGGEKSRTAREGGRLEDAPGPNGTGQELKPGTPGKVRGERPLHGVKPMERTGAALELRERLGASPRPGERTRTALGPMEQLGSALGPRERTGAAQGPGSIITGVTGLKKGSLTREKLANSSGPPPRHAPGHTLLQRSSVATSSLDSALGPMDIQECPVDNIERLKSRLAPRNRAEKSSESAPGSAMRSGAAHRVAQDSVAEPLESQGGNLGLVGPQDGVSGPSAYLDSALGPPAQRGKAAETPLGCARDSAIGSPASRDSAIGSPASRDSAPGPSASQDDSPESKALCAVRAAQMSGRQQELGVRARLLCRRLQVIQAKQVERHVRQQLSGLVELLSERGPAGLPGSPNAELDRLASSSTARLRAAQGGFDSDATESSSGGESDAEEVTVSPEEERSQAQGSDRRAEWRWAVERAAIICRWTWLQAQVSDLEFRIRQQTEFYKQIRCTKGGVVLGESTHCEDSTTRQTAGSPVVLNARGNRVPSSSVSQTTTKTPSGGDPCDGSPNAPKPSSRGSDKQCSRLTQSVEKAACQNPATPLCDSSASQKSSRQVNGLLNCVRSGVSCNGSAENLDPEGLLGKKRRMDALSPSPALPDSTWVAARTRPLRGHKKRRLVRCSDVSSLSRKPQKQPSTKCGCAPSTSCILCECKTSAKSPHPTIVTLNERIALIDPCYHPILSFPYDTPLHLHFESLLKEDGQFRQSHKLKILKLSGKKPQDRVRRDSLIQSSEITGRSVFRDDRQYRGVSSPSIHVSSPFTQRPNPAAHQLSSLLESPLSSVGQQNSSSAALKRKRFENSYDIDNIVIPMSLVAASRVEKLQYKEILTPSWCLLDSAEKNILEEDPQLEELSDETYQDRHSKYEDLERSRWDSWNSALPQRRGSRSSNKSEGRWTPQPPSNSQGSQQISSPDMRFHSLNDGPLSLSSAAADNLEPYSTVQCLTVHSRTRVLSWSEDTRSSTPEVPDDEEQTVEPWEHRFFPLSDRDYCTLQESPVTPNKGKTKLYSDGLWQTSNNPGIQTESIDSGMSTEHLTPASKESLLPNSISVVRVRSHSGDKITSLEYLPARPVNKR